jgi:Lysophospholipase
MKKILKIFAWVIGSLFILLNIIIACHAYTFTHFYDKKTADTLQPNKLARFICGNKQFKKEDVVHVDSEYTTISITTLDSFHLNALESKPNKAFNQPYIGTVILFHGYGQNINSFIGHEANVFRQLRYKVLMIDFRAHGNSEGTGSTIGINEAKDVKAAYDYATKEGEKNIVLYGISMGAASITKAVYDYQLKPAKVILDMPYATLYDAIKGYLRIAHMPVQPVAPLLMFWASVEKGAWVFNMQPALYAKAINCPVLLEWGMNDPRVTENETEAIFKNLDSRNKLMIKYAHSAHESLLQKEPAKWVNVITAFLQQ